MPWLSLAILFASLTVFCFTFVLAYGAPYLPTLSPQIKQALKLLDLKPGQTLLELGSGDGRVMLAAAQKGINVTGYELNPLLVLVSRWRLRRHRDHAKVIWGNFWRHPLPPADAIFTFLLNPYMAKLDNKITQDLNSPVKLVSYAFEIPCRRPAATAGGLYLYKY